MSNIVIFGATSAIAQAVLELYSREPHRIVLVGRDANKLEALRAHHGAIGSKCQVSVLAHDFSALDDQAEMVEAVAKTNDTIDIALIAFGSLPDQDGCEQDCSLLADNVEINFVAPALLSNRLASKMVERGCGTLAVITSVAGDRGRPSNYAYGSAKAGLSVFVDGLRGRLFKHGVHVVNIKPGFVSTPMTAHLRQGPLFASAGKVARDIVKAIEKKRDVVYTPFFWRYVMMAIKMIPNFVFKRISI